MRRAACLREEDNKFIQRNGEKIAYHFLLGTQKWVWQVNIKEVFDQGTERRAGFRNHDL
jgi:hypothetical protein